MATTTSQVLNIITQIHTTLTEREGLEGVAIFKRAASPRDLTAADNEYIVVAVSVDGTQSYPMLTTMVKQDQASIRSVISVRRSGGGDDVAEDVDVRVHELFAEVEDALRSDPSLMRQGRSVVQITDYAHAYSGDDASRQQTMEFTIELDEHMVST